MTHSKTVRRLKASLPQALADREQERTVANTIYQLIVTDRSTDYVNTILADLIANIAMDREIEPHDLLKELSDQLSQWFDGIA